MTSPEPKTPRGGESLETRGYHITVDDGRDSFFALCIEDTDSEDAWVMSDTVRALDNVR